MLDGSAIAIAQPEGHNQDWKKYSHAINSIPLARPRYATQDGAFENSLQSVLDSYKFGFRCVECDLTHTSDGVLVLNHGTSSSSGLTIKSTDWETLHAADPMIATWHEYMLLCKKIGVKIITMNSNLKIVVNF